jgi:hypothetical protein
VLAENKVGISPNVSVGKRCGTLRDEGAQSILSHCLQSGGGSRELQSCHVAILAEPSCSSGKTGGVD